MNSIEALWAVHFTEIENYGAGVTVIETDRIFGGDSYFYWTGRFTLNDGKLKATVQVKRHSPGNQSIIGLDSFDLELEGIYYYPAFPR